MGCLKKYCTTKRSTNAVNLPFTILRPPLLRCLCELHIDLSPLCESDTDQFETRHSGEVFADSRKSRILSNAIKSPPPTVHTYLSRSLCVIKYSFQILSCLDRKFIAGTIRVIILQGSASTDGGGLLAGTDLRLKLFTHFRRA